MPLLIATVGLFGAAAFATVPGLQARVIGLATVAPTLAAAVNISAATALKEQMASLLTQG